MPKENLWSLYAMSDCFLLTNKAEGLGLPIMEQWRAEFQWSLQTRAQSTATARWAILIPPEYIFTDVWEQMRHMISIEYLPL
jgi:hypothetical protein